MKIEIPFSDVRTCEEFMVSYRSLGELACIKTNIIGLDGITSDFMPDIFMAGSRKMNAIVMKGNRDVKEGDPLFFLQSIPVFVERTESSGS